MVSVCDYNISCSIPGSALNKGSPVGLGYYGSICRFEPTGGRGSSCARIARHCERRRSWSFKNLSDFFGCFGYLLFDLANLARAVPVRDLVDRGLERLPAGRCSGGPSSLSI